MCPNSKRDERPHGWERHDVHGQDTAGVPRSIVSGLWSSGRCPMIPTTPAIDEDLELWDHFVQVVRCFGSPDGHPI
jgi:hypothetical protein